MSSYTDETLKEFESVIKDYIEYALNKIDFSYYYFGREIEPNEEGWQDYYITDLECDIRSVLFCNSKPSVWSQSFNSYVENHTKYKPILKNIQSSMEFTCILENIQSFDTVSLYPNDIRDTYTETMNNLACYYQELNVKTTEKERLLIIKMMNEFDPENYTH